MKESLQLRKNTINAQTEQESSSSTMAEIIPCSNQTHLHTDPALQSLFHALDPISLLLHPNSYSHRPVTLRPTTENYVMERGPRYRAYAELRESKLRMKSLMRQESKENEKPAPQVKKQVKFQANSGGGRKTSSILAQSVPDFSSVLRKENRKPTALSRLPTMIEMTPPPAKTFSKNSAIPPISRGSKSASAGEKKVCNNGGFMSRKSYANIEELKGLTLAASAAINGEIRGGGRSGKTMGKTVLSYRQF